MDIFEFGLVEFFDFFIFFIIYLIIIIIVIIIQPYTMIKIIIIIIIDTRNTSRNLDRNFLLLFTRLLHSFLSLFEHRMIIIDNPYRSYIYYIIIPLQKKNMYMDIFAPSSFVQFEQSHYKSILYITFCCCCCC